MKQEEGDDEIQVPLTNLTTHAWPIQRPFLQNEKIEEEEGRRGGEGEKEEDEQEEKDFAAMWFSLSSCPLGACTSKTRGPLERCLCSTSTPR